MCFFVHSHLHCLLFAVGSRIMLSGVVITGAFLCTVICFVCIMLKHHNEVGTQSFKHTCVLACTCYRQHGVL